MPQEVLVVVLVELVVMAVAAVAADLVQAAESRRCWWYWH
jgi:hypothetical protein